MRNNLIFNSTYLELVENNISKFSNKWDISQIHNFLSCRCGIDAQIDLDIIKPYTRFKGKLGEQHTLFIKDPCGNCLEFKAFKNDENIFKK